MRILSVHLLHEPGYDFQIYIFKCIFVFNYGLLIGYFQMSIVSCGCFQMHEPTMFSIVAVSHFSIGMFSIVGGLADQQLEFGCFCAQEFLFTCASI